jgi:hypothetical protein
LCNRIQSGTSRKQPANFALCAVPNSMWSWNWLAAWTAIFHAVMSYGIIFWGNSSHSTIIFRMQKKAIRIMEGCGYRVSCRDLFKKFQILPFLNKQWKSQFTPSTSKLNCLSKRSLLFGDKNL